MIFDLRHIRKLLFFIALVLHCVIGGAIAFSGVISYRPFYVSLLILLLIVIYKIRIDNVLKFHIVFGIIIIISGCLNGSSFGNIISALRLPIFSQTMYLVVYGFLDKENYSLEWLLKSIALVQLPVVLFQMIFFSVLSDLSAIHTSYLDIRYGTFFVKSDSLMSTFLILLVIYLLYVKREFSRYNIMVIVTSCITIFLADSRISQISILGIVAYYVLVSSTIKQKIGFLVLVFVIFMSFFFTGYTNKLSNQFADTLEQITFQKGVSQRRFEEGEYARAAAILYFMSEPLKIFGDGPGKYVNPITGEMELGLQSQYLKSYAETGLVGMVLSIVGVFVIVLSLLGRGFYRYLVILTIIALGVTSDLYNDSGLMFIVFLFLNVISKEEVQQEGLHNIEIQS